MIALKKHSLMVQHSSQVVFNGFSWKIACGKGKKVVLLDWLQLLSVCIDYRYSFEWIWWDSYMGHPKIEFWWVAQILRVELVHMFFLFKTSSKILYFLLIFETSFTCWNSPTNYEFKWLLVPLRVKSYNQFLMLHFNNWRKC